MQIIVKKKKVTSQNAVKIKNNNRALDEKQQGNITRTERTNTL